jgi:hypothetical protein
MLVLLLLVDPAVFDDALAKELAPNPGIPPPEGLDEGGLLLAALAFDKASVKELAPIPGTPLDEVLGRVSVLLLLALGPPALNDALAKELAPNPGTPPPLEGGLLLDALAFDRASVKELVPIPGTPLDEAPGGVFVLLLLVDPLVFDDGLANELAPNPGIPPPEGLDVGGALLPPMSCLVCAPNPDEIVFGGPSVEGLLLSVD